MVKLTASLEHWLVENNHMDILPLLAFGHLELFTDEMKEEYLKWVATDEGKRYLVGGDLYHDPR